jgi:peptidoglycan-N-acetylglucosamine deacetylase
MKTTLDESRSPLSRASALARMALAKGRGKTLRTLADALPQHVVFQHGARSSKKIALTFDDGPGPLTRSYLDVLEAAGARGTFFVIGNKCEAEPALLAEIEERGHEVAGHGWSHTPFPELASSALATELKKTTTALGVLRRTSRIVRPPYGRMTPRTLLASYRAGYASAMWSVDPLDWQKESAGAVAAAVFAETLRGGDIVLLHDDRKPTLEAIPEIVRNARLMGFEPATVSEVLSG